MQRLVHLAAGAQVLRAEDLIVQLPGLERRLGGDQAGDPADTAGAAAAPGPDATEHLVEDDEDRCLHEDRHTPTERVDAVLLVEGHHLGVQALAVVLVLRLQLLELRLMTLHLQHRTGALQGQRGRHRHHDDREDDDGAAVAVGGLEEQAEEAGDRFEEPFEDAGGEDSEVHEMPLAGGTGSYPWPPHGWQRARRRIDRRRPRSTPWLEIDSSAYDEQLGSKRHGEGRPAVRCWYRRIAARKGRDAGEVVVTIRSPRTLARSDGQHELEVHQNSVRVRLVTRRTGTARDEGVPTDPRCGGSPSAAGGPGSSPPRIPRSVRSRTRRAADRHGPG